MKSKTEADRRKLALRENLKRRKSQLREFGAKKDAELSVRKAPLAKKMGKSVSQNENGDDHNGS
jgi:hypothetical protein